MNDQELKDLKEKPVNPNFEEAFKEILPLLDFVPEGQREMLLMSFAKRLCEM